VWIHPADAAARGITDGQPVRVFNDRGHRLPARVTDRIAPGVVSIKEGAWFTPDASGQDTRGCPNVLIADRASPGARPRSHVLRRRRAGAERELSDRPTIARHANPLRLTSEPLPLTEERTSFAGALRAVGGVGAMSGPHSNMSPVARLLEGVAAR